MDKVKSFLKGEKESSSSSHSHHADTHHSGSTTGAVAREAEQVATGHQHSTPTASSTTSSMPTTAESYETQDQTIAPAVEKETVKRFQEEQVQQVVDIERHQDHYHTTVQPLEDRVVEPTINKDRVAETQYSEIDRDDAARTRAALEAQQAQFQNTRTDLGTTKTQSDLGTIQNETIHNHMHETIQPVIEREVIQPSVIHTTVPIHEVVHEQAHIHDASTAPPMTVEEFSKLQGSSVTGSSVTGSSTTGSNVPRV